jgi:hypothetical protein
MTPFPVPRKPRGQASCPPYKAYLPRKGACIIVVNSAIKKKIKIAKKTTIENDKNFLFFMSVSKKLGTAILEIVN